MSGILATVGYSGRSPQEVGDLCQRLQATLVDVRSRPTSRRAEWRRERLEAQFGHQYAWRGDRLGGMGAGPTAEGLDELAREIEAGRNLVLLCAERAPGDCHRHHRIAVPLLARGIDAVHVYRDDEAGDVVIAASELVRADAEDDDCWYLSLGDWLRAASAPRGPRSPRRRWAG